MTEDSSPIGYFIMLSLSVLMLDSVRLPSLSVYRKKHNVHFVFHYRKTESSLVYNDSCIDVIALLNWSESVCVCLKVQVVVEQAVLERYGVCVNVSVCHGQRGLHSHTARCLLLYNPAYVSRPESLAPFCFFLLLVLSVSSLNTYFDWSSVVALCSPPVPELGCCFFWVVILLKFWLKLRFRQFKVYYTSLNSVLTLCGFIL